MRFGRVLVAAVVMALIADLAVGQDKPTAPKGVFVGPEWVRRPTSDDLISAFPADAKASEGRTTLSCMVSVQGLLRDCKVATESPAGQGFGAAALAIVPQFLFRPATQDGRPLEVNLNLPFIFRCDVSCRSVAQGGRKLLNGLTWTSAPTQTEMVAVYPPKAKEKHILGVASIQCEMTATGGLKNCDTMSEEPRGQGFGKAAISLAKYFNKPTNVAPDLKLDGAFTRLTFTFGEQMYDGAPYVAKPKYAAAPTLGDLMNAYRAAAPKPDDIVSGEAMVKCRIVEEGALTDCTLIKETPAGQGIGAAVLAVAPKFKLQTWTDDGLPVIGTSVRLPIKFDIKDPPKVEPAKATNAP